MLVLVLVLALVLVLVAGTVAAARDLDVSHVCAWMSMCRSLMLVLALLRMPPLM